MKVLLLKPINETYFIVQPSLGLGYVAAIFLRHGHDVRLVHSGKEGLTWPGYEDLLRREAPDLVGIQMLSHEVLAARRHVEVARRLLPNATILIGGAHFSGDPLGTMISMPGADFGFLGEAEPGLDAFLRLAPADWRNPDALAAVPNLVWRRAGEIVLNTRIKPEDLCDLPLPAWHLMPPADYPVAPHGNFCRATPVAPLITSRGCPFPCTFCAGHNITGRQVRFRTPDHVMREIEMLHRDFGVREIHIEDEVFTLRKEYAAEICRRLIDSKLGLSMALPNGVRLDSLDEEILRLLERAGFYSIGVGIEAGTDRVLKLMRKKMTTDFIRRQVELIKRVTRIHLTGFFIFGYPSETVEEVEATIEFAKSLPLDKANFMFLSPLPGSELWDDWRRDHPDQAIEWANIFSYRIIPGISDIPPETIRRLHRRANREFYLRPRIMLGLLRQIQSFDQLKFLSRRAIGIFKG